MKRKDETIFFEILANACISALREMSKQKIPISAETMVSMLSNEQGLKKLVFFSSDDNGEDKHDAELTTNEKKELLTLKKDYERLGKQRESLLNELNLIEEKKQEADRFYRRVLMLFADMQKNICDPDLNKASDHFRKLVREDAGLAILDEAFEELKDKAFKTVNSCEETSVQGKKGFLSYFFKDKKSDVNLLLFTLQESFQEIIDYLRLNIDTASGESIEKINTLLKNAKNLDDFALIRRDILNLVSDYIRNIQDEREAAAGLIREIAGRIDEMEKLVLSVFMQQIQADAESNLNFSVSIKEQFDELGNKVSFAQTLSELKETVVTRLNIIKDVLSRKHVEDEKLKEEAEERYKNMQLGLYRMRNEISRANEKSKILEEELLKDFLTGAYNRRAYDRRIKDEMERFKRYGTSFSLLIFDIDHFKKVNDAYGHAIGDKCLKAIIEKVTPLLRSSDFLARFGGEEFTLILPETGLQGLLEVGEKLRLAVENIAFFHENDRVQITISLGGTVINNEDKDYEMLFARMDKALYDAKNSGRNKLVVL